MIQLPRDHRHSYNRWRIMVYDKRNEGTYFTCWTPIEGWDDISDHEINESVAVFKHQYPKLKFRIECRTLTPWGVVEYIDDFRQLMERANVNT